MITADTLTTLTSFTAPALTRAARLSGHEGPDFSSCKFIGITNAGQFCYTAVFHVKGGTDSTKVFLSYNHTMDRVFTEVQLTQLA